jgi:hypothetical protein
MTRSAAISIAILALVALVLIMLLGRHGRADEARILMKSHLWYQNP